MSIFKCKMCGGSLEISKNQLTAVCEYCGTTQTLPKLDDDKKANMYDRANHFRRNNEFDKAMAMYEQILNEDKADAEAYWSLVLCRYGIEYVEDPRTHKRVPTVNRAQFTSIFDDDNYKTALKYADAVQRSIYAAEANAINEIQKGILDISQKEEPFDVFICYKETDNKGRRTPDSVLANDLYHQLTQEGFKVFFSRITLEDKLGVAYEPYIFAALNSAKVMVVLGTKPEYFNAVWVKNEWSRYLSLVKASNGKKMLIPAYKDMDPYDLPDEFSHLQAQDMGKLGFMQDLIRGVKKLYTAEASNTAVKETVVVNSGGNSAGSTAPLLKRAFMYLEDSEWESADEYCEKVLDQDPENAEAYLGKLMSELKCHKKELLSEQNAAFANNKNYLKVLRFGDEVLKAELTGCNDFIVVRNEELRQKNIYDEATKGLNSAVTESECYYASRLFQSISNYKDANSLIKKCSEKAKGIKSDALYVEAVEAQVVAEEFETEFRFREAIEKYESIAGWKDVDQRLEFCRNKLSEIEKQNEHIKKIAVRVAIVSLPIIVIALIVIFGLIIPHQKYNDKYTAAMSLCVEEKYDEAIDEFNKLNGYKDSEKQIESIMDKKYNIALRLSNEENYAEAIGEFKKLIGYKDSEEQIVSIEDEAYIKAMTLYEARKYVEANEIFREIPNYKNSHDMIMQITRLINSTEDRSN